MATKTKEIPKKIGNIKNEINPPISVKRHDDSTGRWYHPTLTWWRENEDKKAEEVPLDAYRISTTSFLNAIAKGPGFDRWLGNAKSYEDAMAYASERAMKGTMVHAAVEWLLHGDTVDTDTAFIDSHTGEFYPWDDEHRKYIMSFLEFYKTTEFDTEATEVSIWHHDHPTAGTVDWVVQAKHKKTKKWERWMIDFKTGNAYDTHQLQLSDYKMLWDLQFPDQKIDHIAGLYLKSGWRENPNFKFVVYDFRPDIVKNVFEIWKFSNPKAAPKFKKEYPATFELEEKETK
tara:strand:+ start:116 stop:979 length:864 start_codon:yes stop_codon:yes gene_type:complete